MDNSEIDNLLHELGLTANYIGFKQVAYALQLCKLSPDRLLLVTKCVYPDVAKHYNTSWKSVARNIRTASNIIWRENRPLLEKLAHRTLNHQPHAGQLLAILSFAKCF